MKKEDYIYLIFVLVLVFALLFFTFNKEIFVYFNGLTGNAVFEELFSVGDLGDCREWGECYFKYSLEEGETISKNLVGERQRICIYGGDVIRIETQRCTHSENLLVKASENFIDVYEDNGNKISSNRLQEGENLVRLKKFIGI